MKSVGLILASVVCVLTLASSAASVTGPVRLQATVERVHIGAEGQIRSEFLRLWNPSITSKPIGHQFLICGFLGRGHLLGSGRSMCRSLIVLPRGQITSAGVIKGPRRYTLIIVGGSGDYTGANGVQVARPGTPGQLDLTLLLS